MKTKQAIETHGHLLEHIAIERITVEFEKLLTGTYCVKGLKELVETKLFSHLPYLQMSEERLLKATQYKWDSFETDIEAWAFSYIVSEKNIHLSFYVNGSFRIKNKRYCCSFIGNSY